MNRTEMLASVEKLRDRLERAQRRMAGLREKSKILELQYDDAKVREKNSNELVMELLERQHELNVMLNRTNIMLNRTQEVMALTSVEFNEMAKALPEPKKEEWSGRISKINDLFKKTGVADAELPAPKHSEERKDDCLSSDELDQESDKEFNWKDSVWNRNTPRTAPQVEATPVDDHADAAKAEQHHDDEIIITDATSEPDPSADGNGSNASEPRKVFATPSHKSWWRR